MAYGFKLGQIEGLDSSVEKVNLTITGSTTDSYVLNYGNEGGDEGWADNVENPNFTLHYHLELEEYVLIAFNMDETDVGDEYTINLSIPEAPTQAFKEAVEMVTEEINLEVPEQYQDIISSAITAKISEVIAADGKPCILQSIQWTVNEDTDIDAYNNFYNSIKEATLNRKKNAYIGGISLIDRKHFDYNDQSIISYEDRPISAAGYLFWVVFIYTCQTINSVKDIRCDIIAALLDNIS